MSEVLDVAKPELMRAFRTSTDALFSPKTVAVIGATDKEGSVGRAVLENLDCFGGKVFPVNSQRGEVLGHQAFPKIAAVPEPVDLAVIVTPAPTVPGIIRECAAAGVKGAIIISAGFKEVGPEGAALEREILAEARRGGMRLIGPNCLGVMTPQRASTPPSPPGWPGRATSPSSARAARSARRSSTGACARRSASAPSSRSARCSTSGWGDLIDYLGNDPHTQSILIYMESIGDARAFLSAAREVALTKPIIVIKAGRTAAAAKAAASHTGSLTGSDEVLDAAFRRAACCASRPSPTSSTWPRCWPSSRARAARV